MNISNKSLIKDKCYINGQWINSYNGELIEVNNPSNLEKVTNVFFQNKRKMIKKPLNILFKNSSKIVTKLNLDEKSRPQNLNPQTFFKISKEFENELTLD